MFAIMLALKEFGKKIITGKYQGGYESEPVRKNILINSFLLTGIVIFSAIGINEIINNNFSYGLILLAFGIIAVFFFLFNHYTGKYRFTGNSIVAVIWGFLLFLLVNGGDNGTGLFWFFTFPIMAFYITGRKTGLLFVASLFLVICLIIFMFDEFIYQYSVQQVERFIFSFITVSLLTYIFEFVREKTYISLTLANQKKTFYLDELRKKQAEIIAQSKQLEKLSIVASKTDNAIMILDAEGNFEWVNDSFTRMYSFTYNDLIQKHGKNIINSSTNAEIKQIIKTCIDEKKTTIYDSFRISAGKGMWTQTTLTPILDNSGSISKIIAIDADITKIKTAEEEIQIQSKIIEKKNYLITDSISYAKRIQEAMLPDDTDFSTCFPKSFVFFCPRDIVSGDFYWHCSQENNIFIAAVDCTGHGVPGAFMSVLGNTLLNEIVIGKRISDPSKILRKLDQGVVQILHQNAEIDSSQNDGMDISLCCIDKSNDTASISMANHRAFIITNGEFNIIEGDIHSIGGFHKNTLSYTCNKVSDISNKILYLFSDGFQDQFGGSSGRKYMIHRFENLIKSNYNNPMREQKLIVESEFLEWKGNRRQVDDVLVIGIDFSEIHS